MEALGVRRAIGLPPPRSGPAGLGRSERRTSEHQSDGGEDANVSAWHGQKKRFHYAAPGLEDEETAATHLGADRVNTVSGGAFPGRLSGAFISGRPYYTP